MIIVLQGLVMGLTYAMPIGSQNVFVLNESSSGKLIHALKVASIVSVIDISLAIACLFGMSALIDLVPILKPALSLLGGVFLLYLGVKIIKSEGHEETKISKSASTIQKVLATAFFLTWFNPQALIDGSVIFGGIRSTIEDHQLLGFMVGASLGSILWFFSLSITINSLKKSFTSKTFKVLHILCGLSMIGFSIKMFASLFDYGTNL